MRVREQAWHDMRGKIWGEEIGNTVINGDCSRYEMVRTKMFGMAVFDGVRGPLALESGLGHS